jgi:hypothetical protein
MRTALQEAEKTGRFVGPFASSNDLGSNSRRVILFFEGNSKRLYVNTRIPAFSFGEYLDSYKAKKMSGVIWLFS